MRGWIYDKALLPLTVGWYREVLTRLPTDAKLLDIGIGTAGALSKNADLVTSKGLHVVGVDIDPAYVKRARKAVTKAGIHERVDVKHVSIYDFTETGFHAAYFSASFMIMPDPLHALRHVMSLLRPDGRVYFTQTFEEKPSVFLEKTKPLLKKLTTIEFGQVTYERDFMETVNAAGLQLVEHTTLNQNKRRSGRLIVGRPQ
jgi:tRNA A58 N-methylase Trm61